MIYKSYLVEKNINLLKSNLILFYGENIGLINEFKKILKKENETYSIVRITEENILNNQNILFSEIYNESLFEEKKIIFIDNVSDKILNLLKEIQPKINNNKIYLFSGILEKKSKLRSYAEKLKDCDIIPCYKDSEINLRNLIQQNLKGYTGLNAQIINSLIENSNLDRTKIQNELEKIKIYFSDKIIKDDDLNKLLNIKINDDFDVIKDSALKGNKITTNKLLSSTIFEIEKTPLYIVMMNKRLSKIKEIVKSSGSKDVSQIIDNMKPPIFWKDKPNYLHQTKIWNLSKINEALKLTYQFEVKVKSNNDINKHLLLKKLLLDICLLATS
jgi:DNA polymerase-3 subunit delta